MPYAKHSAVPGQHSAPGQSGPAECWRL